MSDKSTDYSHLVFLDNTDQPLIRNARVSALKNPIRRAVNENRTNPEAMQELITLLQGTLTHVMKKPPRKKKPVTKKEETYDLP